ncbi:hypothetical protein GWI33_022986 [Rhynchophorus ferrugineus]|uniref:Uncharacterized protein n=1 Tax=Rhynchophorus ferrugineus TaxID=354439 RepID=A0A834IRP4_RHYFE|nr:hypothetical protein GWI33_022986 [Rhynchophorus ferrugineus]
MTQYKKSFSTLDTRRRRDTPTIHDLISQTNTKDTPHVSILPPDVDLGSNPTYRVTRRLAITEGVDGRARYRLDEANAATVSSANLHQDLVISRILVTIGAKKRLSRGDVVVGAVRFSNLSDPLPVFVLFL